MSDRETILEFKNVCKRFPGMEKNAVDSVNLSIKKGEFVTILGTSGSGKTTLMKMVNLLYDISDGDILFKGQSIKDLPPVEHRRKNWICRAAEWSFSPHDSRREYFCRTEYPEMG